MCRALLPARTGPDVVQAVPILVPRWAAAQFVRPNLGGLMLFMCCWPSDRWDATRAPTAARCAHRTRARSVRGTIGVQRQRDGPRRVHAGRPPPPPPPPPPPLRRRAPPPHALRAPPPLQRRAVQGSGRQQLQGLHPGPLPAGRRHARPDERPSMRRRQVPARYQGRCLLRLPGASLQYSYGPDFLHGTLPHGVPHRWRARAVVRRRHQGNVRACARLRHQPTVPRVRLYLLPGYPGAAHLQVVRLHVQCWSVPRWMRPCSAWVVPTVPTGAIQGFAKYERLYALRQWAVPTGVGGTVLQVMRRWPLHRVYWPEGVLRVQLPLPRAPAAHWMRRLQRRLVRRLLGGTF